MKSLLLKESENRSPLSSDLSAQRRFKMLPFEDRISSELKDAMRSKDQIKMDCLRAMKSALKYKAVEKSADTISEEEAFQVFQSMMKQRKDAIEQFEKFGRSDQAAKEKRELDVISSFLPKALSEAEISGLIQEAIKASGASSARDMGKVMKELKPKITGRADSKLVSDLVKAALPNV